MPDIIAKSISILSDAGLGMAMFSLGQYKQKCFFFLIIDLLSWRQNSILHLLFYDKKSFYDSLSLTISLLKG